MKGTNETNGIYDSIACTDSVLLNDVFGISFSEEEALTRREQEIPHFYKWWDELR